MNLVNGPKYTGWPKLSFNATITTRQNVNVKEAQKQRAYYKLVFDILCVA